MVDSDSQLCMHETSCADSLAALRRHRGAGASIGRDGSVRSVRENTMLSFQKAAVNHSDFIEFDVHVTADSEVVVHHDFDVKLAVGREIISLGIPSLTYAQLST